MNLTAERTTVLIDHFPVDLRLRVRAKAMLERRRMHEVFAELVERGLAAAEAEAKKEGKP